MGGIAGIVPSWVGRGFEEVRAVGNRMVGGVASTLEKVVKVYQSHKVMIAMSVMALGLERTSIPAVEISESLILFSLAGIEFDLFLHYCSNRFLNPDVFSEKSLQTIGASIVYSMAGFMKGISFLVTRVPKV